MISSVLILLVAAGIFLGMLVSLEIGRRLGAHRLAADAENARHGIGALEGAVFGVFGLLIAFTFSNASSRFNDRRQYIREEANTIGTAWLRLDLLPPEARTQERELFRRYLDSRIAAYGKLPDIAAFQAEVAQSVELQGQIWTTAIAACRESGSQPAHLLLLPALNDMIDIVTTRTEAMKAHAPAIIFVMVGIVALVASLMAGYGLAGAKSRNWAHVLGFVGVMATTVLVIVDLEFPRVGLIRLDSADQVLVDLRASMVETKK
jgi:hypothetical protein